MLLNLGFARVEKEVQAKNSQRRYDIVVYFGNRPMYVDFTVISPSSSTYVNRGSYADPDATLNIAEYNKQNKYSQVLAAEVPPVSIEQFVPFAVETNGKIGKGAEKFLREMALFAKNKYQLSYYVKKFKREMWQVIYSENALIFHAFRNNVIPVTINDVHTGYFRSDA